MTNEYEHPMVTRALRTGYGEPAIDPPACPWCTGELSGTTFCIEGDTVCRTCFLEWLSDYAETNPTEVADALRVDWTPDTDSVLFG